MKKQLNSDPLPNIYPGIKYIIFDLGGVLIKIYPDKFYQKYPAINESLRPYQEIMERRLALGHEDPFSLLREIIRISGLDNRQAEEFIRSFTEDYLGETIRETEELISDLLKNNFSLCLLSNTNQIHFEHARQQLPYLQKFHRLYLSYEMHMIKPEKDVFLHIINDLKVKPEEILLIDDTIENVTAAREIGMQAVKVTANHPAVSGIRQSLA